MHRGRRMGEAEVEPDRGSDDSQRSEQWPHQEEPMGPDVHENILAGVELMPP